MLLPKTPRRKDVFPRRANALDTGGHSRVFQPPLLFQPRLLFTPRLLFQPPGSPGLPDVAAVEDQWVNLGGVPVKLMEFDDALDNIMARAAGTEPRPLGVCSANLDHIRHFGVGGRWEGTLDHATSLDWLTLIDGAPLATAARRITSRAWPRLAGSDLVGPLLDDAEKRGLRVGFLGGTEDAQESIRGRFAEERPNLRIAGWWAPERSLLADRRASLELAATIAQTAPDILVVGLGKPRQELWINEFGPLTGANVVLAFGAVVDFLAGRIRRAPVWVSSHGLEWAWRLMLEPRRLARRYLVDGPEAYIKLRRASAGPFAAPEKPISRAAGTAPTVPEYAPSRAPGSFVPAEDNADVAVIVVTYENADDVGPLVSSLRKEAVDLSMKVVVADNSPGHGTMDELAKHPDVVARRTGGNLGYAGGINAAMQLAGDADAYLILNPDLRVEEGAVEALRRRMAASGAGMVVPVLLDDDGSVYPSLRREPGVLRALGDAALGSRLQGRPAWLSEMDCEPESYQHAHRVEWATGAALLISADAVREVGAWDEQFFLYSEETDYCRRLRDSGRSIWFEPSARMWHERGGSGTSPQLTALMSVNRVRYAAKYLGRRRVQAFRAVVLAAELVRLYKPGHREAFLAVLDRRRWDGLPKASRRPGVRGAPPTGAIIIPAHNESAVIGRTLGALEEVRDWGTVEVIVACNGCTDDTGAIAARFHGVRVISVEEASKTAALNAADQAARSWPRLYLDADIEVSAGAVEKVFRALEGGLLAARPEFRYDTSGASGLVRSYYRARNRIPANAEALWGAGVFALSAAGHERLGAFPAVTGDDYYVDRLFGPGEKSVVATEPVVVRTPRTSGALLGILRRTYRGNAQQHVAGAGATTARTLRQLLASVRGPLTAVDAVVYAAFAGAGRRRALLLRKPGPAWERDDSSR